MSKKLSEIGTERWFHYNDKTETVPHEISFTPEERRELVRNSIKKFILEYVESYELKDGLAVCIGKLFEEHGL